MRFTAHFDDGTKQTFVKKCTVSTAYAIARSYAKEKKKQLVSVQVNEG